ncbi:hypothetical protein HOK00_02695 [bacterium]|jgi:3-hydroxyacyl-[acyl-carrier-protein] dehydratase|nr:hypothetical protein [bacterium]
MENINMDDINVEDMKMDFETMELPEEITKTIRDIDLEQINELIPHREPFLLVDHCEYIEYTAEQKEGLNPNEQVVLNGKSEARFLIKEDMPIFKGHFPTQPVYPGVYLLEGMAQAGSIFFKKMMNEIVGENQVTMLFSGIVKASFRKIVFPGSEIKYVTEVKNIKMKDKLFYAECKAYVGNILVSDSVIVGQPSNIKI